MIFRGGHWFQEDCSKNMKFACKHIEDDPPTPPPPTYCLDGWYGFQVGFLIPISLIFQTLKILSHIKIHGLKYLSQRIAEI